MCMPRGELPATRFLKRQPAALTLLRKGDSDCRSEMKDDGNWGCPGICWCGTLDAVLECYLVGVDTYSDYVGGGPLVYLSIG